MQNITALCEFIRCRDCGAVLEEYDEETLALAVVVLSMFIHLSPDLAAPLLLEIMQSVGRYGRIRLSTAVCALGSLWLSFNGLVLFCRLASSSNFTGQAER